ncbi:MAG: Hsp20/alpha crystallin family protein [Patescibacteria group bacterium]|jgi:HSP20 family protein
MVNDKEHKNETAKSSKEGKPTLVPVVEHESDGRDWLLQDYSGQLAVDVYQTEKEVVIVSTIAGVRPEEIDISINNDMVTIRGRREQDMTITDDQYFYKECYWGGFSRSIILPVEVKADRVQAGLKNGILTITLPKVIKANKVKVIKVKEE